MEWSREKMRGLLRGLTHELSGSSSIDRRDSNESAAADAGGSGVVLQDDDRSSEDFAEDLARNLGQQLPPEDVAEDLARSSEQQLPPEDIAEDLARSSGQELPPKNDTIDGTGLMAALLHAVMRSEVSPENCSSESSEQDVCRDSAEMLQEALAEVREKETSPSEVREEQTSPGKIREEEASPPEVREEEASPPEVREEETSPGKVREEEASPPEVREEETKPPEVCEKKASPKDWGAERVQEIMDNLNNELLEQINKSAEKHPDIPEIQEEETLPRDWVDVTVESMLDNLENELLELSNSSVKEYSSSESGNILLPNDSVGDMEEHLGDEQGGMYKISVANLPDDQVRNNPKGMYAAQELHPAEKASVHRFEDLPVEPVELPMPMSSGQQELPSIPVLEQPVSWLQRMPINLLQASTLGWVYDLLPMDPVEEPSICWIRQLPIYPPQTLPMGWPPQLSPNREPVNVLLPMSSMNIPIDSVEQAMMMMMMMTTMTTMTTTMGSENSVEQFREVLVQGNTDNASGKEFRHLNSNVIELTERTAYSGGGGGGSMSATIEKAIIYRRNEPGSRREDWCNWPDMPFEEMDSTLNVQQYIQQCIHKDPSDVDTILKAPSGQEEGVWKYEHVRQFCMQLNGLTLLLQDECKPDVCVQMTATEQWIFLCAAHKNPKECSAIDYTRHTLDGAAALLNSNKYFPSRVSIKESSIAKIGSVCRRIYRIFSHAYFHHRELFEKFEAETHLCRRFTVFVKKYNLMANEHLIVPIPEQKPNHP